MREIRLSEVQNRVMWILEEAGEETVGTVAATLQADGFAGLSSLPEAVAGLVRLGFVRQESDSIILTDAGYEALTR